jgi:Leucine-rich repeat (LRR) protein
MHNTQISDISALTGLTNLTELWLPSELLTQQQIDDLRQALPNCNVTLE